LPDVATSLFASLRISPIRKGTTMMVANHIRYAAMTRGGAVESLMNMDEKDAKRTPAATTMTGRKCKATRTVDR
jgi:hypothetical protein